jgi:pimeloyl-ACP methyl ester carboxylesterase
MTRDTSTNNAAARSAIWSAVAGVEGAPRIALVHGSLDRSAGLLKLSRRLDESFRVVRYDRRGYGRSTPHTGPFGIDHQVADLVGVLTAEAGPSVVVGHSYGGNVALAAAQRRPDLVAGVVVYESPLSWLDWWPGLTAGASAREWMHDPSIAAERFMRRLIGDRRWDKLPDSTRAARRAEGPALIGELDDLQRNEPWSRDEVRVPVLAVRGEHAADHHRQGTTVIADWFGTEPVVLRGARHFGPNTHPDEMGDVVTQFARTVLG